MYFLLKNKYINPLLIGFLIFSFLGDFSSVFFSDTILVQIASLFYCLSYLCLVFAAISRIRNFKMDAVVGAYLIIVFVINSYLMYELFSILQIKISDSKEILFFGIKSIALMILAFTAFLAYLNRDSKTSILFLGMALTFVFADVLYYISNYYVYHYSFVVLDRVLHVFGLFFLFNYMIAVNRKRKKVLVENRQEVQAENNLQTENAMV